MFFAYPLPETPAPIPHLVATLRSTCHTLSNVYIRFPTLAHFREKKIVAMTYESTLIYVAPFDGDVCLKNFASEAMYKIFVLFKFVGIYTLI
jgi:hypothetical protein